MKTTFKILLSVSIVLLVYFCFMSIYTPIHFNNVKEKRDAKIIEALIDLRNAELEYKTQKGVFTDNPDELVKFLKSAKKQTVLKEGSLSDKQLEAGLTEAKATKIVQRGNWEEIKANGLERFRRDTTYVDLIATVFHNKYTIENIDQIVYIPFSKQKKFDLKINNEYKNNTGTKVPLFEASAHFSTYLGDLNRQELLNIIDIEEQLSKFPGLKVGDIVEPNNNAGNWE